MHWIKVEPCYVQAQGTLLSNEVSSVRIYPGNCKLPQDNQRVSSSVFQRSPIIKVVRSHLADGSHLHDILELLIHVPECEFPVLDSVVEFLVVTNVKVFNNFHQTFDVTHTKQLLHKRNCVEGLKLEQTSGIL